MLQGIDVWETPFFGDLPNHTKVTSILLYTEMCKDNSSWHLSSWDPDEMFTIQTAYVEQKFKLLALYT